MVAVSVTDAPGETAVASVSPALGVVASSAEQLAKLPPTKSDSVEVNDWEERVSARKEEKHSVSKPNALRLMPPSKNVRVERSWPVSPAFGFFTVNGHGDVS